MSGNTTIRIGKIFLNKNTLKNIKGDKSRLGAAWAISREVAEEMKAIKIDRKANKSDIFQHADLVTKLKKGNMRLGPIARLRHRIRTYFSALFGEVKNYLVKAGKTKGKNKTKKKDKKKSKKT